MCLAFPPPSSARGTLLQQLRWLKNECIYLERSALAAKVGCVDVCGVDVCECVGGRARGSSRMLAPSQVVSNVTTEQKKLLNLTHDWLKTFLPIGSHQNITGQNL